MRGIIGLSGVDFDVVFHQVQKRFRLCRVTEVEHLKMRVRRYFQYFWILSPAPAKARDDPEEDGIAFEELRPPGFLVARKQYLFCP